MSMCPITGGKLTQTALFPHFNLYPKRIQKQAATKLQALTKQH